MVAMMGYRYHLQQIAPKKSCYAARLGSLRPILR